MRLPWHRAARRSEPPVDTRPLLVRAAEDRERALAAERAREEARRIEAIGKARLACAERLRWLGIEADVDGWQVTTRPQLPSDNPDLYGPVVMLRGTIEGAAIEAKWSEAFVWEFGEAATSGYCALYAGDGREVHRLGDLAVG